MSIPGVVPIWCSVSKRYQKLQKKNVSRLHPGSLTVCPFKNTISKGSAGSNLPKNPSLFRGDVMASNNVGGVFLNAKNFFVAAKSDFFSKQATPWHHDNVADSWNAIPLTSVVQSHSTHLSTGTGIPEKYSSIGKRRHMKKPHLYWGAKMVESCNCQNYRLSQNHKKQNDLLLLILNIFFLAILPLIFKNTPIKRV